MDILVFLLISLLATLVMRCDARSHGYSAGGIVDQQCALTPPGIDNELAELTLTPPTDEERAEVYAAIDRCSYRTKWGQVDPWRVLALVRLEPVLGVPPEHRGVLPAIWCIEASMRTKSRTGGRILGDYRAGVPISQGPFQIQKWMEADCGGIEGARHDLIWAARCWVTRVDRVLPKAEARCPQRAWVVSEAMVSNPRKYRWDCRAASLHYRLLL